MKTLILCAGILCTHFLYTKNTHYMNMMVYNREWDTEVTVSFDIPNVNYTLGYILVMQMTHNLFDSSRAQSRLTSINQSSRRLLSVQCLCTAPLNSYYGQYRANTVQIQYKYSTNTMQIQYKYNSDTIYMKYKCRLNDIGMCFEVSSLSNRDQKLVANDHCEFVNCHFC